MASTSVYALPATHYADHSVLRSGTWVKIATTQRGIHCIDAATLQSWGFADAASVSLYGQDGYMQPETFSETDTDDLVPLPVYAEDGNLYFYASGSTKWEPDATGTWSHTNNYYSNIVYYFLTADRDPKNIETITSAAITEEQTPITQYDEYTVHEKELICVGQTGRLYMGEDLLSDNSVTINAPSVVGDKMQIFIALGAKSSATTTLISKADGKALLPNISVASSDSYVYLREGRHLYGNLPAKEETQLTFTSAGGVLSSYYLDFVRIFYTSNLVLEEAQMQFRSKVAGDTTYFAVDIASHDATNLKIWNVNDVLSPYAVTTELKDGKMVFASGAEMQEYVAFDTKGELFTPEYVGKVEPQDLHGIDYIPDMVIVTTRYFIKEAERIAQLHRDQDNMKVLVCEQLSIFNEFSGGTPDATAIRRMMKMFYDRAAAGYGNAPRYLLLYGRGSYNNRLIAPSLHDEGNKLLVTYQSVSSTDARYSYVTDDYFAFLADETGVDITAEKMDVAVGRMPVATLEESQKIYNKLVRYSSQKPSANLWKNKACFIGKDGDGDLHMRQSDAVAQVSVEAEQKQIIVDKVFMGAYADISEAREQIYHDIDEGAIVFNYMGHADPKGIGGGGSSFMTIADVRRLTNSILPVFITATCDVCPFDKDELSVGEEAYKNENGAFIALFTTTRTVYTNGNEAINKALMQQFFISGVDGKVRLGDIMKNAKTSLVYNSQGAVVSDGNKMKYCLIGDPAMALPLPEYKIKVENINGASADGVVTVSANSMVTVTGMICDAGGKAITNFDGRLCYEVYDAETTEASQRAGSTFKYNTRKYKLVTAADTIAGGKFTTTFRLPEQCLQNGGTAFVSLYAYSDDMEREASGYNSNLLISGIEEITPDVTAPTIKNIWIENADFSEGGAVPANTLFHCDIIDEESGLTFNELSMGKGISLWLDGVMQSNDLSGQYTANIGYGNGSIDYPLLGLGVGTHTLTLRAFDNAGNSAEVSVSFVVEAQVATNCGIAIAEDPVLTQATISLEGAMPTNVTSIRYVVADATTGSDVWTATTTTTDVVWNLQANGSRVPAGNYTCKAYIEADSSYIVTETKNFIVLGQ